jgi:hypothetical protein
LQLHISTARSARRRDQQPPERFSVWRQPGGSRFLRRQDRVLNENLAELRQIAQDALEDAI